MALKDKQVDAFIRRLQKHIPIDVVAIARVLGLVVYESHALPEGIAGKIFQDKKHGGEGGYSIVVRGGDPFVRKRFTVAHEIAHYLLHRHLFSSGGLVDDALYRSQLSGVLEAQANNLAADLLMPWHLLAPLVATTRVFELADKFQVSEQAMKIRLESRSTTTTASAKEPTSQSG